MQRLACAYSLRAASHRRGASALVPFMRVQSSLAPSLAPASLWVATRLNTTSAGPNSGTGFGGDVEDREETHPDFQPRMVATDLADDEVAMIKKDIDDTIKEEDLVVFIKGVPEAPMCAFSKRMIDVLEALGVEYTSFDVLAHPVVRTYVKEVSEWPTIPQLFMKGEFCGGVDIILKMAESGDLQLLLDQKGIRHRDSGKGSA